MGSTFIWAQLAWERGCWKDVSNPTIWLWVWRTKISYNGLNHWSFFLRVLSFPIHVPFAWLTILRKIVSKQQSQLYDPITCPINHINASFPLLWASPGQKYILYQATQNKPSWAALKNNSQLALIWLLWLHCYWF